MVGTAPRFTARQIKVIPRELGVVVQACDPGTGKWSQIIRSRWDHSTGVCMSPRPAQVCVCMLPRPTTLSF